MINNPAEKEQIHLLQQAGEILMHLFTRIEQRVIAIAIQADIQGEGYRSHAGIQGFRVSTKINRTSYGQEGQSRQSGGVFMAI